MRYFDNVSLLEIKRMTPQEYDLRMKAVRLKRIDRLTDYATLALFERKAKETKQIGDKTYLKNNTPKDIFDYEKEEQLILTGSEINAEAFSRLKEIALNLKRYRQNKAGEDDGR